MLTRIYARPRRLTTRRASFKQPDLATNTWATVTVLGATLTAQSGASTYVRTGPSGTTTRSTTCAGTMRNHRPHTGSTRVRRRLPLIAVIGAFVLTAAIAAGAVLAWRAGTGAIRKGGPLALPKEFSDAVGAPIRLGVAYSWGGVYLSNNGSKTATADEITLIGKPREIRVTGMYVVRLPSSKASIGFLEGYSGAGPAVRNLDILPGASYQVVIGVRVDKPGRYLVSAVHVRYHVGDVQYEDTFQQKLRLCAPLPAYEHCPVVAAPPA